MPIPVKTSLKDVARLVRRRPGTALPFLYSAISHRIIGPLASFRRPGGIAMFHIGRCGSTVLGDLLGQHPRIYWDSETYARVKSSLQDIGASYESSGLDPGAYVRRRRSRSGSRWYGFDLKFHQVTGLGWSLDSYLDELWQADIRHLVLLRRRNLLRSVVSAMNGARRGMYHNRTGELVSLDPLLLDPTEVALEGHRCTLVDHFDRWNDQYAAIATASPRFQLLQLTYEDDVEADPRQAYRRVVEFLELPSHDVRTTLRRSNPEPLGDLVYNVNEVAEALRGTSYEWMVDD